jgi:hypothetical protein
MSTLKGLLPHGKRRESWQNRNDAISQQRRQRSKSGQQQSIFNVELTPERDSQHLRTAGEGRARRARETTQLCGLAKRLGKKNQNKKGEISQQALQYSTNGHRQTTISGELPPGRLPQHLSTVGGGWVLHLWEWSRFRGHNISLDDDVRWQWNQVHQSYDSTIATAMTTRHISSVSNGSKFPGRFRFRFHPNPDRGNGSYHTKKPAHRKWAGFTTKNPAFQRHNFASN